MKRLPEYLRITLPPVNLYLEDVEYILQHFSGEIEVQIEHRGFAYDSLQELKDLITSKTINELRISHGCINIEVTADTVSIFAGTTVDGRATIISEYLRSRVPWYSWRPRGNWWYMLQGALSVSLIIAILSAINLFIPFPAHPVLSLISRIIISFVVILLVLTKPFIIGGSRIHLYPKVSEIGFWERNRDKIIVGVITALCTSLITSLIYRASSH